MKTYTTKTEGDHSSCQDEWLDCDHQSWFGHDHGLIQNGPDIHLLFQILKTTVYSPMKTFSFVPPLLITSFSCRNVLPTFSTSLLEAVTAHKT